MNPLTRTLDDLTTARDEALAALERLPKPQLPEEDRPPHWFRHLYNEFGEVYD